MYTKYYAHSLEGEPPERWQPLDKHLENVAKTAAAFARPFGGEAWAELAGENHDIGKGTLQWQAYLRNANGIADEFSKFYNGHPIHADVGAKRLFERSEQAGKVLTYCIAGHHGGLPNWDDSLTEALSTRLKKEHPEVHFQTTIPDFPTGLPIVCENDRFGFQLQFFVRMLFSCLVDADFLDTERTLDKEKSKWRSNYPSIDDLHHPFWKNFNELRQNSGSSTLVNRQREIVLQDCLAMAEQASCLFSLTVPTGGGKTLASLAFALNHAKRYNKRRVVYVVPFTSIIEQNAQVFRDMLGEDAVLEHHCNFIPDEPDRKTKLAAENWDAPVVLTTNVQFFNSFYACKPSKCRKLHNVADSVVIFDEVQAIPVERLKPCLEVIKELSLNYGVTSVLCTATQPAVAYSDKFTSGLKEVVEIVQNVPSLFTTLKRTEEKYIDELSEQEVANRIADQQQVLCIVNTRQQALDIFEALPESVANIHLSALMYPAHRTRKLNKIRQRLRNGKPCRVVSTQLIEAGVDVDFPCVYRAIAGIDSIAQAAGRCNRNGLSPTPRAVFVFAFPEGAGCGVFRQAAQSATKLFARFPGKLTSPDCVRAYFADYFWKNEQRMDAGGIVDTCLLAQSGNIQFRDIAEFKMIQTATIPIIVALEDKARKLVRALDFAQYKGTILRRLQQYTVQIYSYQRDEISGWLESPVPEVFVLNSDELYSDQTGLQCRPPEDEAFFG